MSIFGLRKTWVDPGPGIAMVQVHWTTSPRGTPPDWSAADQVVASGGPVRSAVLEVPRDDSLSLHHFFFVVTASDRTASPVFTEDIVAREVSYEDREGLCTSVGVVWSSREVPNYTSAVMDGLPFAAFDSAPAAGDLYEFVRAQPLPHTFRGAVWGVAGDTVEYGYHLISNGRPDPSEDHESWLADGRTLQL
ncbi:hypothetical protein [Paractinoplanes lichenicola]|uniref:Uncharacterized protein n=1 Tax=Paractinoplanes lichenicola TaxID=2802976 RepID=A0ABS1VI02_9ACTN|nr:hypothetical protein [Actinoplanes lichenicola]MBL7253920.1 hypothetical protein [Actinoplanes lichenicola]